MKHLALTLLLAYVGAIGGITSALLTTVDTKAQPEQIEGLYIYYKCKPISETDYLGTVKTGITWGASPHEFLNKILKKVKADYPAAQAVIITDVDMQKADAVKFKK